MDLRTLRGGIRHGYANLHIDAPCHCRFSHLRTKGIFPCILWCLHLEPPDALRCELTIVHRMILIPQANHSTCSSHNAKWLAIAHRLQFDIHQANLITMHLIFCKCTRSGDFSYLYQASVSHWITSTADRLSLITHDANLLLQICRNTLGLRRPASLRSSALDFAMPTLASAVLDCWCDICTFITVRY